MKKSLKILLCLGGVLLVPRIFSQELLKIGHVNVAEIVTALPESDSARMLLEKDTKELKLMIENMQVEYNKLIDDFEKNQGTYSELVSKTKQSEILEVQNKINSFQQNASEQLKQRNIELLQPIYQKVQKAIDKTATLGRFTYILDISQGTVVFFSTDSQNINSLVLNELGISK